MLSLIDLVFMNGMMHTRHACASEGLDFTIKKGEWIDHMDDVFDYVDDLRTKYPNVTIRITEF